MYKNTSHKGEFKMNTREKVLKEALNCVNGEREKQYGNPEDNFRRIADLWSVYLTSLFEDEKIVVDIDPIDVAKMMILFKIARSNGDKDKLDNYVDMIGYGACAAEIFENENKERIFIDGWVDRMRGFCGNVGIKEASEAIDKCMCEQGKKCEPNKDKKCVEGVCLNFKAINNNKNVYKNGFNEAVERVIQNLKSDKKITRAVEVPEDFDISSVYMTDGGQIIVRFNPINEETK